MSSSMKLLQPVDARCRCAGDAADYDGDGEDANDQDDSDIRQSGHDDADAGHDDGLCQYLEVHGQL